MVRVQIESDSVRGELPGWAFELIDWDRLADLTQEVVLAQDAGPRRKILESSEDGRRLSGFSLVPFDADGFLTVCWGDQPILQVHVTNLFPLARPQAGGPLVGPEEVR